MHQRPDQFVVYLADAVLGLGGQRRDARRGGVGPCLFRVPCSGDDDADSPLVEDPAQGELGEGQPVRHQRTKSLDSLEADLVRHTGECLADVEGGAVPIEVPVVVFVV